MPSFIILVNSLPNPLTVLLLLLDILLSPNTNKMVKQYIFVNCLKFMTTFRAKCFTTEFYMLGYIPLITFLDIVFDQLIENLNFSQNWR